MFLAPIKVPIVAVKPLYSPKCRGTRPDDLESKHRRRRIPRKLRVFCVSEFRVQDFWGLGFSG